MNFSLPFHFTFAIFFQVICCKLSNGLDLSLCLDLLSDSCGSDNSNSKGPENDSSDPTLIIKNGFNNFNSTVVAAENIALHGFSQASALIHSHPNSALHLIQDAIQESQDKFFESGIPVYLCIGKASSSCKNCDKKPFVEAIQKLLYLGLNILDTMRLGKNLAAQGITIGGEASKQVIKAIKQKFQADLAAFYQQIPLSYQQSIEALSDSGSSNTNAQGKKQNSDPTAKDPDATAAILEIYNNAKISIDNGSNRTKVTNLSQSLRIFIGDIAQIELFLIESFLKYQKLLVFNQTSAKNELMEKSESVHKRIQEIFTNICLEFVTAGENLSEEQIGKAFVIVEHGNDKVTNANNMALQIALDVVKYEANIREIMFTAVLDIIKFGRFALYHEIVQGVKIVFDAL